MKVDWSEPAVSDLESIRNYIARDSDYYAARFVGRIIEAVDKLESFPKIGRKVPEANNNDIRELLFQNYRIIYLVEDDRVLILAVVHGSRDLDQQEIKPWEIIC